MTAFQQRILPPFKITYANELKISTGQGPSQDVNFDLSKKVLDPNNQSFHKILSNNNFINAQKVGYLNKKSESYFKSWTEKFCVLTNVGLLYYNDPTKRPRNLFPIVDTQITSLDYNETKKNHAFRIKAFSWEIVFATKTEQDKKEWLQAFKSLQDEYEKKRQKLMHKAGGNSHLI